MNLIEFSIACKLISAKLKNVAEVPKQLPPSLIASLQHIGTPIRTPTGAMSPTESYKQFLTQQPVQNPTTMIHLQNQPMPMMSASPVVVASQPIQQQIIPQQIQPIPQQPVVQEMVYQQQMIIPTPVIPQAQTQIYTAPLSVVAPTTVAEQQSSSSSLLDNLAHVPPTVVTSVALPAAPTPPQSGHASRSMSFSEKAPSIPESP